MESRTDQQAKDKVLELIKDVRIAMMASRGDNGQMHARPMATNTVKFDGSLWFFTDIDSPKIHEIEHDPEVLITYSDDDKQHYVSVSGRASVVQDADRRRNCGRRDCAPGSRKGRTTPGLP